MKCCNLRSVHLSQCNKYPPRLSVDHATVYQKELLRNRSIPLRLRKLAVGEQGNHLRISGTGRAEKRSRYITRATTASAILRADQAHTLYGRLTCFGRPTIRAEKVLRTWKRRVEMKRYIHHWDASGMIVISDVLGLYYVDSMRTVYLLLDDPTTGLIQLAFMWSYYRAGIYTISHQAPLVQRLGFAAWALSPMCGK